MDHPVINAGMAIAGVAHAIAGVPHAIAAKFLSTTPEQELGNIVQGQQPEDVANAASVQLMNQMKYYIHTIFIVCYVFSGFGVGFTTLYLFFNPLKPIIIPIIAGSIGLAGVVLRMVFGSVKARGIPVSWWGIIRRVAVRMGIVYGLFKVISDLVKARLARTAAAAAAAAAAAVGATAAASPLPAPVYSTYSLIVLMWLASLYGVFVCDIGLGLYGSGETGISETCMVLFAGFLISFSYTSAGLNVGTVIVMVSIILLAIMLYSYQMLDNSLLPTTNGLRRRVVRLENVLISHNLHLPPPLQPHNNQQ